MQSLKSACILFLSLTLLTGMVYPFVLTGLAHVFFYWKAKGCFITFENKIIGSQWIGQNFESPNFFQGRPSKTPNVPYNAFHSSGSNMGPTNPLLIENIKQRILEQQKITNNQQKVPIDLVTSSASGLDPDISPASAFYQATRIAKKNHVPDEKINILIHQCIHYPWLGLIGEPTVNVLELNVKLLSLSKAEHYE